MSHVTRFASHVPENKTCRLTATLVDETGTGIEPSEVTQLVVTLYERSTGAIINSRDHQDIKGANGGTLGAGGALALILSPADNVRITTNAREEHVALVEFRYNTGLDRGSHEFLLTIKKVTEVEAVP